jgi:hypothetical protein
MPNAITQRPQRKNAKACLGYPFIEATAAEEKRRQVKMQEELPGLFKQISFYPSQSALEERKEDSLTLMSRMEAFETSLRPGLQ